ncbi:MAG: AraC family transcriptional regulator [Myxococcota bacterium]
MIASSQTFGWEGLKVYLGEKAGWDVKDLVTRGHLLAINLDDVPLQVEVGGGGARTVLPGTLWVQPGREAFSFRVVQRSKWGVLVLDPTRLASLLDAPVALAPEFGIADPAIVALVHAALAETRQGGLSGKLFADGLVTALGCQLRRRYGGAPRGTRGGLTTHTLRRLTDFIDAHLADDLRVDDLARHAQLSPGHFSRAFKEKTGTTPRRFVQARRVTRAKALLESSRKLPMAWVAQACGFADQAHFSRSFKKATGVTPTNFVRASR